MEIKKAMAYRQPINDEGLLRLNLQFFADGDGGDSGEGGQGGQGDQPPNQTPAGDGGQGQQPQNQQNQQDPPKTFTQDDVNNIVAKEAKKAQEKLLKQLGIEDFNSAKEGLQKFKEWQESQKTEAQKQAERLQELETNFNTVNEENASLKAQISAMKSGVHADYVQDVVILAKTLVNEETDIEAAIQKVVEKYPHFKQAQQEPQQQDPKPQFTTGQHQKQPQSELEKWLNAFKN
ncbi:hypothetical protein PB1_16214 [Bacillus methanolicus PB1]|uniref:Phage protein n=1 Tax=Bacillus methanolicus PB1 TaxID=997296 RepID=I3DXZ7_BACMT|nr:hypothetical protein [Bacillus methanolicus]EIJ79118.1 hypothetical protein PB1_16214 [Bacillus methanolicus PB1]